MLSNRTRGPVAAMLAAALALPVAAGAQEAAPQAAPQAGQQKQKMQKIVQEYRQAAQKLQQIRQETIAENPELEEQREAFETQVQDAMSETGYDVEAGRTKMEKLGKRFQNEELSKEERQKLASEFQAERQKMQQAQQKVLQQEDIRKAGEKLQEDTLTAMKEQDPQTEELLQRMEKLRQQLQAMQPSGAMGGGSQGG